MSCMSQVRFDIVGQRVPYSSERCALVKAMPEVCVTLIRADVPRLASTGSLWTKPHTVTVSASQSPAIKSAC